ncbi:OLC1v1018772C1 [Oldenlandia corymbosa var. corymbosa]|uniref:OLC1v1018772C1 n=1 Tax=Oldenlandia corymbosa var. corymbosa TaxID=529605 RepID=A0AAV1ECI6_OLDCO|nr:OLC1v1018772C1 [Oldenlandia corymbosa var. corymbosa]
MKKAFGQTVRDIKREVNKKVLKVPSIEQKVLDATSNEPWGPHGTLLADIAQASRNYHEYQMIMSVIWKRVNDTGKNWRHVYKALTVLEYMVAHGSERVIDEIREHAYQIQTLSDFQYIDSSGRDQGSNVRKKSQSLVVLVNDKDRIQEVRQKAAANRDKYRNTAAGGMYRPGSYSSGYDDDRYDGRYGGRDEDRNGYGREREWGSRDDDRYGRYGDSYGRDGDRYNRDEDRYARDGYRDDDYRGRSRSVDDYQYGSRSRSSDRDRDRSYEDDGQYSSSRGNGARTDDQSQDGSYAGRNLERKYSEPNLGAPPSYEEAVSAGRSPTYSDRDGDIPSGAAAKSSSPTATVAPSQSPNAHPSQPEAASPPPPPFSDEKEVDGFDEFDPRGSFSSTTTSNVAAPASTGSIPPASTNSAEMDLLGALSDSLAIVPTTAYPAASEDVQTSASTGPSFTAASASSYSNQAFDDPFGDGPFKAVATTEDFPTAQTVANPNPPQFVPQKTEPVSSFGETSNASSGANPSAANIQYSTHESSPLSDIDILADILPPTGPQPPANSQTLYAAPNGHPSLGAGSPPQSVQSTTHMAFPSQNSSMQQANFPTQSVHVADHTNFPSQSVQSSMQNNFPMQSGQHVPQTNFVPQTAPNGQPTPVPGQQGSFMSQSMPQNPGFYGSYNQQMASSAPAVPQMTSQLSVGPSAQQNTGSYFSPTGSASPPSQMRSNAPLVSQASVSVSTGSLVPAPPPAKDKFETKSTVWTDTLSRGLVNLNISGPKTNPLADIGVDFDAINRKEKRLEKPTNTPTVSNVTMGKAMGSGSGIGRAGAGAIRPPPNPMVGSGMGIGGAPGQGMGMGGYPSMNQPMGGMGMNMNPNMGMGMNMNQNMGMGMNMGIGQGGPMQRPMGFPPGSAMPGGYNPMMGMGNYGQQPYGGGYR